MRSDSVVWSFSTRYWRQKVHVAIRKIPCMLTPGKGEFVFELQTCKKLNPAFGQRRSLFYISVYVSDVCMKSFLRQSITCGRQKAVTAVFPISSLLITFRYSLLVIVPPPVEVHGKKRKNVWGLRLAGSDHASHEAEAIHTWHQIKWIHEFQWNVASSRFDKRAQGTPLWLGLSQGWSGGGHGPSLIKEKETHSFSSCFYTRFPSHVVIRSTDVCVYLSSDVLTFIFMLSLACNNRGLFSICNFSLHKDVFIMT